MRPKGRQNTLNDMILIRERQLKEVELKFRKFILDYLFRIEFPDFCQI